MKKRWIVGVFAVGFAAFFAACDGDVPVVDANGAYEFGDVTDLDRDSVGSSGSTWNGGEIPNADKIPESIAEIVFAEPPASFCFVNVDTISAGESATWYYTSRSGKEETFSWVFPEGPDTSSTEASVTITYPYGGQYSGKVIVKFEDGSKDVEIECANVANVIGDPAPGVSSSSADSTVSSSSEDVAGSSSSEETTSSSDEAAQSSSGEESAASSSGEGESSESSEGLTLSSSSEGESSASGDESSTSESSSSSEEPAESSSSSEEATSSDAGSSSSEKPVESSSSEKPVESSSSEEPVVSSSSEKLSSSSEVVSSSSEVAPSSSSEALSSSSEEVASSSSEKPVESSSSKEPEVSSSSEKPQESSSSEKPVESSSSEKPVESSSSEEQQEKSSSSEEQSSSSEEVSSSSETESSSSEDVSSSSVEGPTFSDRYDVIELSEGSTTLVMNLPENWHGSTSGTCTLGCDALNNKEASVTVNETTKKGYYITFSLPITSTINGYTLNVTVEGAAKCQVKW